MVLPEGAAVSAMECKGRPSCGTRLEGFLLDDDPILLRYNEFRDDFGREGLALIAIHSDDIFSFEFLEKLRALHEDLEENVVHLDEVNSLINARSTRGAEGELIVEDLFEDWPQDASELAVIRDRALANPIYRNLLLSEDGAYTLVAVRLNTYSPSEVSKLAGFDGEAGKRAGDFGTRETFLTGDEVIEAIASVEEVVEAAGIAGQQSWPSVWRAKLAREPASELV